MCIGVGPGIAMIIERVPHSTTPKGDKPRTKRNPENLQDHPGRRCVGPGSLSAIAAEPIKIGSILSVTGPAAFLATRS